MDKLVQGVLDDLENHNDAYHLDASTGRTSASSYDLHQQRRNDKQHPPQIIVGVLRHVTSIRQHRSHVEQRGLYDLLPPLGVTGQLLFGNPVYVRCQYKKADEH